MALIILHPFFLFRRNQSKDDATAEDEMRTGPVYANPTFSPNQHQSTLPTVCGGANQNNHDNTDTTTNAYEVLYSEADDRETGHADDYGTAAALYDEEQYNALVQWSDGR